MKAALVYTSTTPELINTVEYEVRKYLGNEVVLLSYQDASVLAMTRDAGYVTREAAARLYTMYMNAILDGADAILNVCSSVGMAADAAHSIAEFTKTPIVRIDDDMCRDAVRRGQRIGVLATLATTLDPTKATIRRAAAEMGRNVELVDGLVDGAFGLDREQFLNLLLSKAEEIKQNVDIILLAQGSMAYCAEKIQEECGVPVLSSPGYGAAALKNALSNKGVC